VIGHEKHKTGGFRGVCFGQMTGHSGTDGFAYQIFGQAVGQQIKSFLTGSKDTPFVRRTFAEPYPGYSRT